MITIPPYLRKGDTVGLICPAGFMPLEKTESFQHILKSWGFKVCLGKTVGNQNYYFSGTDAERLQDLQNMLDMPDVKAIICARGGYGTSRIIDEVKWKHFKKFPKWIAGYSDVTVLNCHLFQKLNIASLHSPMAGAFENGTDDFNISLKNALSGKKLVYRSAQHPLNQTGKVTGKLIGGNLSLLAHLTGTVSFPKTEGNILFLEDVGEYLYNIDRMLIQLERAGKFKKLGGILIGGFTDLKDTSTPYGKTVAEIIHEKISKYNIPVAWDFPVSHSPENVALRFGMLHTLTVNKSGATLSCLP
ncbi:MAG: LD-carboxypeptidase [Chitinophagaceae bacterium]|jgi:muramoyltetrapeptide carboxypeptidase|nr:LD-carboxypeptidase [Chitinophagaceae bacterium]